MSGALLLAEVVAGPVQKQKQKQKQKRMVQRVAKPIARLCMMLKASIAATAFRPACIVFALALSAGLANAHKGSDAYLDVQEVSDASARVAASATAPASRPGGAPAQRSFRLSLSVAIKDLDLLVPVDANADGKVTWGEVKAATPWLLALVDESVNLEPPPGQQANAAVCRLHWQSDGIERRSDGAYVRFAAQTRCAATQALALRYTLLKDQDATHRLLVTGRIAGNDLLTTTSPLQTAALALGAAVAAVPGTRDTPAANASAAPANAPPSGRWQALRDYFGLGVHHLLEGYDHLAFLLALVLPLRLNLRFNARQSLRPGATGKTPDAASASFARSASASANANANANANAQVIEKARATGNVWWALLRTITAFTIGHSITLVLATFGFTQASPAWVEPVIALSIAVTALLNLRPVPWVRVDVLALLFGMVHGFGFAGLLQEAAAPSGLLPWALAGFNLGVEAGQLIAVSAWVLLSQLLVARVWYPSVVVRGGSVLLILVATFWFWQRVG